MTGLEIHRSRQRLENLFERIRVVEDPELKAHWTRYLCVLVSGFLETSIRGIYGTYAKSKSHSYVANFVSSQLSGFQNPNMQKIVELAGAFSPTWRSELENLDDATKEAINSIVNNRNQISHGADVGMTYATLQEYYKSAIRLVEKLERLCRQL